MPFKNGLDWHKRHVWMTQHLMNKPPFPLAYVKFIQTPMLAFMENQKNFVKALNQILPLPIMDYNYIAHGLGGWHIVCVGMTFHEHESLA